MDLSGLAGVIAGAHALIALRTQHPHWQINEGDAKRYAVAVANVLRHYSMKASQRAIDHAALLFAAVEMDGPRFALTAAMNREAAAAAKQQPAAGATVYRFNQPAPSTADGGPQ